jgi:hypothetical protein
VYEEDKFIIGYDSTFGIKTHIYLLYSAYKYFIRDGVGDGRFSRGRDLMYFYQKFGHLEI